MHISLGWARILHQILAPSDTVKLSGTPQLICHLALARGISGNNCTRAVPSSHHASASTCSTVSPLPQRGQRLWLGTRETVSIRCISMTTAEWSTREAGRLRLMVRKDHAHTLASIHRQLPPSYTEKNDTSFNDWLIAQHQSYLNLLFHCTILLLVASSTWSVHFTKSVPEAGSNSVDRRELS